MLTILLLAVTAFAAPLPKTPCQEMTNLTITGSFLLPLTALADNQYCTYNFVIPSDFFAYASILGFDMNNDLGEIIFVNDRMGDNANHIKGGNNFNSTLAWPSDFSVNLQSRRNTNMKVMFNITLQKKLYGQNVVQRITTDLNAPSTVLYTSDLQEGQTISVTSMKNLVDVKVTVAYWNDGTATDDFNNIFVYDGGVLAGTLLSVLTNQDFVSKTNKIDLYVAKRTSNIRIGAILITDRSNLSNLYGHFLTYLPLDNEDHSQTYLLMGSDTMGGAVTIIGAKDGSNPFDIRQLTPLSDNAGSYSYNNGGPVDSNASRTLIDLRKLPIHITSSVTTIYISKGTATVKYTLT